METSVFIAHSYPLVRQGMMSLIDETPELVLAGHSNDFHSAVRLLQRLRPDVALVESLSDKATVEICESMHKSGLATRTLILAAEPRGHEVYAAVAAGAAGYLTASEPVDGITAAIHNSVAGSVSLSQDAQVALQNYLQSREERETIGSSTTPLLTDTEIQIIKHIANGLSIAETARAMHLSASTVKNHRQTIFAKLAVPNSPAAVYRALRSRIIL